MINKKGYTIKEMIILCAILAVFFAIAITKVSYAYSISASESEGEALKQKALETAANVYVNNNKDKFTEKETYFYGSDDDTNLEKRSFKLESGQYVLKFMFGDKFFGETTIGKATLVPQDYGTGVWFTINSLNLDVGDRYSVNYKVHSVFTSSEFKPIFKSTNESVLKIVKIDYANQQVTIEAVGKGEANIEITVYDDRLNAFRTDYTDGIKNTNFSVTVKNPEKNVDVVAILLYGTAGLMVVYFGYLVYKVIKNRNNYEVR